MNADSASNACCSSSPLTTSWQRSPQVLVPIIASAFFRVSAILPQVFNHSTEDEKYCTGFLPGAGRDCTPLGESYEFNYQTVAFLLNIAF